MEHGGKLEDYPELHSGDEPFLSARLIPASGREPSLSSETALAAVIMEALRPEGRYSKAGQRDFLRALRHHGSVAIPLLISHLVEDNPGTRRAAALGLGCIGDPAVIPHLIPLLADPHPMVVRAAASALMMIGAPAAPNVIAALRDESETVRREACLILRYLGDPRAVPALIPLVESDHSERVRAAAASALGKLRDRRAVQPLLSLLSTLPMDERHAALRRSLFDALEQLGAPEVVTYYKNLLTHHYGDARIEGMLGLSRVERGRAAPLMVPLVEDPETHVRHAVAQVLQGIADESLLPELEKLLN